MPSSSFFAVVQVPFCDVRKEPMQSSLQRMKKDPLQETQCLYGDTLKVLSEQESWVEVEIPNQPHKEKSYTGFVAKKNLLFGEKPYTTNKTLLKPTLELLSNTPFCIGTHLFIENIDEPYASIRLPDGKKGKVKKESLEGDPIDSLLKESGSPYLWGGISNYLPSYKNSHSGIDCSGLVYLFFRMHNKVIPRNASCQHSFCTPLHPSELQKYDLIFFFNQKTGYIDHTMLYLGDNAILEATMRTMTIRVVEAETRLLKKIEFLEEKPLVEHFEVSFGRFPKKELFKKEEKDVHCKA